MYDSAQDLVFDRVFLRIDGLVPDIRLLLKIEGFNPAGSIKLKTAIGLVEDAERWNLLRPGGHIIESSSGNLGVALASVCAARGYRFTCVTDPNTSPQNAALIRTFGARVVVVDKKDANGGYLQSRIDYIHDRLRDDPALFWPNQYANEANPRIHRDRTAAAILDEVPEVDHLFVGAGTTGTLMGCAAHFREHSPRTRIVAVDTAGSVTFGYPPGKRHLPGLGASRKPELCDPRLVDDIVIVPEAEAVRMCRTIASSRGIATGGSTGSVLAAVVRRGPALPPGSTVVAIAPDTGDRYLNTIYNDAWVEERFGHQALIPAGADDHPDADGSLLLKG
ncbi:2,3-diaminopropionate biosynthesis protein SbnA [Streptomyces rugosispiralis]|uniref:2,3-diaminopropionate biosynthesis protein SbnA n=1 Tax=Streptomyces rugosispiralis TaxID=2967341 RepID=A0ABT1UNW6_9ACTN|nr:2,3-diaminopropionate biosynthesis protein SbnA [Streptomyces rugosispiralis]MCQ8186829.1 2,3-diaminopropionate biosynthesis protein SbnA [Streptomyces rugosispiralis]